MKTSIVAAIVIISLLVIGAASVGIWYAFIRDKYIQFNTKIPEIQQSNSWTTSTCNLDKETLNARNQCVLQFDTVDQAKKYCDKKTGCTGFIYVTDTINDVAGAQTIIKGTTFLSNATNNALVTKSTREINAPLVFYGKKTLYKQT